MRTKAAASCVSQRGLTFSGSKSATISAEAVPATVIADAAKTPPNRSFLILENILSSLLMLFDAARVLHFGGVFP